MTYCLDSNGEHGVPNEEGCYCGEEEVHLHAHLYNKRTCGCDGNAAAAAGKDKDIGFLCSVKLYLDECNEPHSDVIPIHAGLPRGCNGSSVKKNLIHSTSSTDDHNTHDPKHDHHHDIEHHDDESKSSGHSSDGCRSKEDKGGFEKKLCSNGCCSGNRDKESSNTSGLTERSMFEVKVMYILPAIFVNSALCNNIIFIS